eukprot:3912007-Alexandrium_andersonii.AAC.1
MTRTAPIPRMACHSVRSEAANCSRPDESRLFKVTSPPRLAAKVGMDSQACCSWLNTMSRLPLENASESPLHP